MKDENIKISKSFLQKAIAAAVLVTLVAIFALVQSPYMPVFVFTTLVLIWGAYYAYSSKDDMSEMCCMMSGMTYGMMSGFFIGAIAGVASGDFMISMVIGTIAGILFGIPVGRIGGPLGRMEGVMAGPMGGIMGAMTGVMIQFFNVELFVPFLVVIVLFTIWEMTNVIKNSAKISRSFVYIGLLLSALALGSTLIGNFNVTAGTTGLAFGDSQKVITNQNPAAGQIQEVTIRMNAVEYVPNKITVKKNIPVRIKLEASPNIGCTRTIVFPDFGIRKTVAPGTTDYIEFTPRQAGTFKFSCSMNMARGTLIVE